MKATGINLGRSLGPRAHRTGEIPRSSGLAPDGEDYIRTLVILGDGHLELDPRVINRFPMHIEPLREERGFETPTIAYAVRSEISP